jgi:hypothetical protein
MKSLQHPLLVFLAAAIATAIALAAPVVPQDALRPRHETRILPGQQNITAPVSFQTVETVQTCVATVLSSLLSCLLAHFFLSFISPRFLSTHPGRRPSQSSWHHHTNLQCDPHPSNGPRWSPGRSSGKGMYIRRPTPRPAPARTRIGHSSAQCQPHRKLRASDIHYICDYICDHICRCGHHNHVRRRLDLVQCIRYGHSLCIPTTSIGHCAYPQNLGTTTDSLTFYCIGFGDIPPAEPSPPAPTTSEAAETSQAANAPEGGPSTTAALTTITSTLSNGSLTTLTTATAAQAQASAQQEEVPGRKLEVLPIGLGVFAGVSVIALIVVGLVTYERTKYRKVRRVCLISPFYATQISLPLGVPTEENGRSWC